MVVGCIGAWQAIPYVVPVKTLFRWSKHDLDAYAAQVMAPGSTALINPPSRLGCFHVLAVEPLPHGFVFQHGSCNPFDRAGLAYSETPLPREELDAKGDVKQSFTPLGGSWYDVVREYDWFTTA